MFENDVIQYGTQTSKNAIAETILFENDVIQYGTQTYITRLIPYGCLRMM